MTFSVSTVAFDGHDLRRGLEILAELGVKWVEPAFIKGYADFTEQVFDSSEAKRLRSEIDNHGLKVQALSAHMSLADPDALTALSRRIECAAVLGSKFLITNAGQESEKSTIQKTIAHAAILLEEFDICLALENPGHGSGDVLGAPEKAIAFLEELDLPLVRLNVDVGNFSTYVGGSDPMPSLKDTLPYASHLHLKDYRNDGCDNWIFTALGQGCIDFGAVLKIAQGIPFGIELPLRLRRPGRADPVRGDVIPLSMVRKAIEQSIDCVNQCQQFAASET